MMSSINQAQVSMPTQGNPQLPEEVSISGAPMQANPNQVVQPHSEVQSSIPPSLVNEGSEIELTLGSSLSSLQAITLDSFLTNVCKEQLDDLPRIQRFRQEIENVVRSLPEALRVNLSEPLTDDNPTTVHPSRTRLPQTLENRLQFLEQLVEGRWNGTIDRFIIVNRRLENIENSLFLIAFLIYTTSLFLFFQKPPFVWVLLFYDLLSICKLELTGLVLFAHLVPGFFYSTVAYLVTGSFFPFLFHSATCLFALRDPIYHNATRIVNLSTTQFVRPYVLFILQFVVGYVVSYLMINMSPHLPTAHAFDVSILFGNVPNLLRPFYLLWVVYNIFHAISCRDKVSSVFVYHIALGLLIAMEYSELYFHWLLKPVSTFFLTLFFSSSTMVFHYLLVSSSFGRVMIYHYVSRFLYTFMGTSLLSLIKMFRAFRRMNTEVNRCVYGLFEAVVLRNRYAARFQETISPSLPVPPLALNYTWVFDWFNEHAQDISRANLLANHYVFMWLAYRETNKLKLVGLSYLYVSHMVDRLGIQSVVSSAEFLAVSIAPLLERLRQAVTEMVVRARESSLRDKVPFLKRREEFVHAQADNLSTAILDAYKALYNMVAPLFGLSPLEIDSSANGSMSTVRNAFALVKDTRSAMNFLVVLLTNIFDLIHTQLYGYPYITDAKKLVIEKALIWVKDTKQYIGDDVANRLHFDAHINYLVTEHEEAGRKLFKELQEAGINSGAFPLFYNSYNDISKLADLARITITTGKSRIRPVVIHLHGPPHQGKSTLTPFITSALSQKLGLKFDRSLEFSKPEDSDFYDGYAGQPFFVCDDWMQAKDDELRMKAALQLIQFAQNTPVHLNMARLESKSSVFFRSPFIILNSNIPDVVHVQKIQSVRALQRRIDFDVIVKIKPSCLQTDAYGHTVVKTKGYDHTIYSLDLCNPFTGQPVEKDLSFREFISRVWDKHQEYASEVADPYTYLQQHPFQWVVPPQGPPPSPDLPSPPLITLDEQPSIMDECSSLNDFEHISIGSANSDLGEQLDDSDDDPYDTCTCQTCVLGETHRAEVDTILERLRVNCGSAFQVTKDKASSALEKSKSFYTNNASAINVVAIIGSLTLIGAFIHSSIAKKQFKKVDEEIYAASYGAAKQKTNRRLRTARVAKGPLRVYAPVATASDQNAQSVVKSVLSNNMAFVKVGCGDVAKIQSRALFIKGRNLLIPSHLLHVIEEDEDVLPSDAFIEISTEFPLNYTKYNLSDCYRVVDTDNDLCLVELPNTARPFRDIVAHFTLEHELMDDFGSDVSLNFLSEEGVHTSIISPRTSIQKLPEYDLDGNVYYLEKALHAPIPTYPLACGTIWVVNNSRYRHKIIGFTVAGSNRSSYATLVTQERLDSYLEKLHPKAQATGGLHKLLPCESDNVQHSIRVGSRVFMNPPGVHGLARLIDSNNKSPPKYEFTHAEHVGHLLPQYSMFSPNKTTIRPSLLYDIMGPAKSAPAALRPFWSGFSYIDPMANAVKKMDIPTHHTLSDLNPELCELIPMVMDFQLNELVPQKRARVLNDEEIYNRTPRFPNLETFNRSSSPGFRWSKIFGQTDKRRLIIKDAQGRKHPSVSLERYVTAYEQFYQSGHWEPSYVSIFLKDERRPLAKVSSGSTRSVKGSELHKVVLEKKYFGAYFDTAVELHCSAPAKLGINPHSLEWKEFYHILVSVPLPHKPFDADMSALDESVRLYWYDLFEQFVDLWYRTYGDQNQDECTIRRMIIESTKFKYYIIGNDVYLVTGKNPSGWFLTTLFNCFIVATASRTFILWWRRRHAGVLLVKETLLLHAIGVFGDDNAQNLGGELAEIDLNEMSAFLIKEFGLFMTSASKDAAFSEDCIRSISELTFLKRRFLQYKDSVLAPLDPDVIREMVLWVHNTMPIETATHINAECALREAFHHGPDYFRSFQAELNKALVQVGLEPITMYWSDMYAQFRGGLLDWTGGLAACGGISDITTQPESPKDEEPEVVHATGDVIQGENQEPANTLRANETQQLTSFDDQVIGQQSRAPSVSSALVGSNCYPDQGLTPVLSRVYTDYITWSSSDVAGTRIMLLDFPRDLIGPNPNLVDKLNRFQFFRAKTVVEIRVNGTRFHYGGLLVAWLPHVRLSHDFDNIFAASCLPHVVVSPNTNEVTRIEIPYVAPSTYWNTSHWADDEAEGWFGQVGIFVLSKLSLSTGTTPPQVSVSLMMHFEDPEVAGLSVNTIVVPPFFKSALRVKQEKRRKGCQSVARQRNRVYATGWAEALVAVKENRLVSRAMETISVVGHVIEQIPWGPARRVGSTVGTISSKVGSVAKTLGFNRPPANQLMQSVALNWQDQMVHGECVDFATPVAMLPSNEVSQDHSIYAEDRDFALFRNYKLIPAIIVIQDIDYNETADDVFLEIPVTPTMSHVEHLSSNVWAIHQTPSCALASFFRYWRGSMKYMIRFFCSSLVSGRVRVSWVPSAHHRPFPQAGPAGDFVSQIFDITGDTVVEFTVPYLQMQEYCVTLPIPVIEDLTSPENQHATVNGILQFSMVNEWSVTDDASNTVVTMVVWSSCAEDMLFYQPCQNTWGPIYTPEVVKATADPLREEFAKEFPPLLDAKSRIHTGIVHGEEVVDFRTLAHRYTFLAEMLGTSNFSAQYSLDESYLWVSALPSSNYQTIGPYIDSLFLFNRGSRRYHAFPLNATPSIRFAGTLRPREEYTYNGLWTSFELPTGLAALTQNLDGIVVQTTGVRPSLEFGIPFYHDRVMRLSPTYFYMPQSNSSVYPIETKNETVPWLVVNGALSPEVGASYQLLVYRNVGDDYSWGWPRAPPSILFDASEARTQTHTRHVPHRGLVAVPKKE